MDQQKYSGKSFFRRLVVFSNEKPVKFFIRIGFGVINVILLYLVLLLFPTIMVYTVGLNPAYLSKIPPYISLGCDNPGDGIIIPHGHTLFLCPIDDGEYIRYSVFDWRGDLVTIEIPNMPCDGEFKSDFWDYYIEEPKPLSTHGSGHIIDIYRFDDSEVYIRRMGGPGLPRFFYYMYFASIPDKCMSVVSFKSTPNMQIFLKLVDQVAFNGETSKTEFIRNVKGYQKDN